MPKYKKVDSRIVELLKIVQSFLEESGDGDDDNSEAGAAEKHLDRMAVESDEFMKESDIGKKQSVVEPNSQNGPIMRFQGIGR